MLGSIFKLIKQLLCVDCSVSNKQWCDVSRSLDSVVRKAAFSVPSKCVIKGWEAITELEAD